MAISDFFTTAFTINRAVWDTDVDGNDFSEEEEAGTFNGHRQQASAELSQNLGLSFTKSFTIWCPVETDVKEGDTIIAEDGSYSVRAIQVNDIGGNTHKQLVVELDSVIPE